MRSKRACEPVLETEPQPRLFHAEAGRGFRREGEFGIGRVAEGAVDLLDRAAGDAILVYGRCARRQEGERKKTSCYK